MHLVSLLCAFSLFAISFIQITQTNQTRLEKSRRQTASYKLTDKTYLLSKQKYMTLLVQIAVFLIISTVQKA